MAHILNVLQSNLSNFSLNAKQNILKSLAALVITTLTNFRVSPIKHGAPGKGCWMQHFQWHQHQRVICYHSCFVSSSSAAERGETSGSVAETVGGKIKGIQTNRGNVKPKEAQTSLTQTARRDEG